jgi:hypothetical protein
LKALELAGLARAWTDLEDARRELSGKPRLKPVEVQSKVKPASDRPKLRPKFKPEPCGAPSVQGEPATPQPPLPDTTIIEKPQ